MWYSDFVDLINKAIELNKSNRQLDYIKEAIDILSVKTFLEEYGTVNINIGRRTGKTKYIMNHVRENDCIVLPSPNIKVKIYGKGNHYNFIYLNDLFSDENLPKYDRVYVELTNFFDTFKLDRVYERLAKHPDQTFVILGEK